MNKDPILEGARKAMQEAAKQTAKIGNNTFTPELGEGKERSVTYETKLCQTAKEIDNYLNRDKYAYSYIYWNPQAKGVLVTLCKPNPKAFIQKNAKRVERGMQELTEDEANEAIKNLFMLPDKDKELHIDLVFTRLYENGFKVVKLVDREQT